MADTELNLEAERAAYLAAFPHVHFSGAWTARNEQDFAVWMASAARRSSSSVSEVEMPELPPPSIVDGPREYWSAYKVEVIVRKAREYQRRVDEKIIARQDAELCRLRAATKAAAPAGAPRVMSYAEMAKWARDNGLNVPPEWEKAPAEDAREEVQDAAQIAADAFSLAWSTALDSVAFYVAGHCADGDFHAEQILGMPAPALKFKGEVAPAGRATSVPAIQGTGGEKLAPLVATKEMILAGMPFFHDKLEPARKAWEVYKAMLAAAPSHPLEAGEDA